MKKDIISVIVPIYNVEKYLNRCIDSIINQTYKNLEIILVDDGSPDNCPKICDEYAKKDDRIKVIHKENGGLSDARNKGIKIASGEYIGFVDSDDYIDEKMYEYLLKLIKDNNAEISVCGYKKVYSEEIEYISYGKDTVLDTTEGLKTLLYNNDVGNYVWNKLFLTSSFKENNIEFPKGKIMEDILTTYKLYEKANRIAIGTDEFYNYVQRENSIVGSKSSKSQIAFVDNILERYSHFENDSVLSFDFFKDTFYFLMRAFIDMNPETIRYIDDNLLFDKLINSGKERGFIKRLSLLDRMRLMVIKKDRNVYSKIMNFRRQIIK